MNLTAGQRWTVTDGRGNTCQYDIERAGPKQVTMRLVGKHRAGAGWGTYPRTDAERILQGAELVWTHWRNTPAEGETR